MNYKSLKTEALEISTIVISLAIGCLDFYYIFFREIIPGNNLILIGLGWQLLYSCWLVLDLIEKKNVCASRLLPFLTYTASYTLLNFLLGCAG